MGFFDKIKAGLKKTRENISSQIDHAIVGSFFLRSFLFFCITAVIVKKAFPQSVSADL